MKLELQDYWIINALQDNGRISNADLAEIAGMSTSACWRRVRALEEAGVILKYRAEVDPVACGLNFHAVLHVQLTRHDPDHVENFIDAVRAREEVLDCFATTGDADYHLRVRCKDLDAYNRFLEDFLFRLPGFANVRTNLVLREIKHNTAISL